MMSRTGKNNAYVQAQMTNPNGKVSWSGLTSEERAEYIDKYSSLIRYIADRLAARLPGHVSKDDLLSAGIVGLIDAYY